MNAVEKIEALFKTGTPVLNELFVMNKNEFKAKLQSICGKDLPKGFIESGQVKKIIINDEPSSIEVNHFDSILITFMGIYFTPEHGKCKHMVEFNEHFKL